jgi:hypothetical protein
MSIRYTGDVIDAGKGLSAVLVALVRAATTAKGG